MMECLDLQETKGTANQGDGLNSSTLEMGGYQEGI